MWPGVQAALSLFPLRTEVNDRKSPGPSRPPWGGGSPQLLQCPHPGQPHVCTCIYVFVTLSLFCVFVDGSQKCLRLAGETGP